MLVYVPIPVPFVVLRLAIVGFTPALQQTPLDVIGAPPSEIIFPPLDTSVILMSKILFVVIVGTTTFVWVTNCISEP